MMAGIREAKIAAMREKVLDAFPKEWIERFNLAAMSPAEWSDFYDRVQRRKASMRRRMAALRLARKAA
jgi:hypothetical protein